MTDELLGPDGKPLDVEKYRPAPEPEPEPERQALRTDLDAIFARTFFGGGRPPYLEMRYRDFARREDEDPRARFGRAVKRQLEELHAQVPSDWPGKSVELEPIPPELTDTYDVAFGSAARNCPHGNSHSTLLSRGERQCDDCGRYFTRKSWLDL